MAASGLYKISLPSIKCLRNAKLKLMIHIVINIPGRRIRRPGLRIRHFRITGLGVPYIRIRHFRIRGLGVPDRHFGYKD